MSDRATALETAPTANEESAQPRALMVMLSPEDWNRVVGQLALGSYYAVADLIETITAQLRPQLNHQEFVAALAQAPAVSEAKN